uniref:Uncharacterized protein n=1 Tax=Knipowitschia caucasica TaxID=637954 RepID=A0AAV2K1G9_KNICA
MRRTRLNLLRDWVHGPKVVRAAERDLGSHSLPPLSFPLPFFTFSHGQELRARVCVERYERRGRLRA